MPRESTQNNAPSIEERQLRALLHAIDPARAALVDVELDDDAMDALAIERAVQGAPP